MVCNHPNMSCRTFFNAFLNKINTVLVHPVEFFHLQQLLVELDLAEVIHPFHTEYSSFELIRDHSVLNEICIIDADNPTLALSTGSLLVLLTTQFVD